MKKKCSRHYWGLGKDDPTPKEFWGDCVVGPEDELTLVHARGENGERLLAVKLKSAQITIHSSMVLLPMDILRLKEFVEGLEG